MPEKKTPKKLNSCEKLREVQTQLVAHKNQFNKFGGYKYRSCEDILTGVKKLEKEIGFVIIVNDEIVSIGDRFYVKATVDFIDTDSPSNLKATAYAREASDKKGMDLAQITGAASSYARKYALSALFAIDDGQDPDSLNKGNEPKTEKPQPMPIMDRIKRGMDVVGFEDKEKRELVVAFKDSVLLEKLTLIAQGKMKKEDLLKEKEEALGGTK